MQLAVVPILVGPLQVLLALLPAVMVALGSALLVLFKPSTFKLGLKLLWRMKVSVLLACALIAGAVIAVRASLPASRPGVGRSETSKRDWPVFRGDERRSGAISGTPSPVAGGIQWAFTGAKTFYSSPAIVGNRVYVTSADFGVFSNKGAIYCLDADTGGVVWKAAPDGYRASFSSPSVSGKYLVVGEGLHQTTDARIFCLDTTRSGAVLWQFRTHAHVESSPVIAEGRVCFGAGDDGYYCFALDPNAHGKPVPLWHLPHEKYIDAETSPVMHDGRVYFGLGEEGQAVCCVDAKTGGELWRLPTPAPVFAPPSIARGKLFAGMGFGNFVDSEEQVIERIAKEMKEHGKSGAEIAAAQKRMPVHGEVWCIDLASHKVDWRFTTERSVLSAVCAAEDRVVCASRDGTVYSLGYDGRELCRWNARERVIASPAQTDRCVYVVTQSGRLYGLDRGTLQPVWETRLAASGDFLSSPTVARGHVYIGSPNDGMLCVGRSADKMTAPIWAGYLGGPGAGGTIDGSPFPEEGGLIWQWPPPRNDASAPPKITAPAAAIGSRIFVPIADGARKGLACLEVSAAGGGAPSEKWFFSSANGVTISPAADDRDALFVEGARGDANRRLHCVEASTGRERWSVGVAPESSGNFLLSRDAIFLHDDPGSVASIDRSGKPIWRFSLDEPSVGFEIAGDILVLSLPAAEKIVALDRLTGRMLWEVIGTLHQSSVVSGNRILLSDRKSMMALSLVDGRTLWQVEAPGNALRLVLAGDFVTYATANGELVVLDLPTGKLRRKIDGATRNLPPLVARGMILYADAEGLMLYDPASDTSQRWFAGKETGTITSPLILNDSSVYFATDRRGFIRAGKP